MTVLLRRVLLLVPVFVLVGCDAVTKNAAKLELQNHAPRRLFAQVLDLRYTENTDVAFNVLRFVPEGVRAPLLLVSGALGVLVLAAILARRRGSDLTTVALVLLLAGALGNYVDRVFRGYVVDFIHVPHWPVFNVADIYVTLGAVLVMWTSFKKKSAALRRV